jgi:exodeoxyribonuclease-5
MHWSTQQSAALVSVRRWLRDRRSKQVFRLFGYAGVGKTTLAREIAGSVDGLVVFATFTGKAALVLKSKGCAGARTIHSLIYKVVDPDAQEIEYERNPDSEATLAKLIVIDEVSMVNEELGRDLESFGVKILVLGDPMQLPPVEGDGYFTRDKPDVLLTEIHRQAADNPIIQIATDVRNGKPLAYGRYGESKIIHRSDLDQADVLGADQVLVGMNKTRKVFNTRIRTLKGFTSPLPEHGDRLICLKNNRDRGLLNGSMWTCDVVEHKNGHVGLDVTSLDGLADPGRLSVLNEFFLGTEDKLDWRQKRTSDEFTYGRVITVHKSQGSQWDTLMLFDESGMFRENRINHLYTAITRAAERITIVI